MKIQFESHQNHQIEAVQAVVDLFDGQKKREENLSIQKDIIGVSQSGQMTIGSDLIVCNTLSLDDEVLLKNLRGVQATFNDRYAKPAEDGTYYGAIQQNEKLDDMAYTDQDTGEERSFVRNFSVEMETGTGKTYVYIRTIYELYQTYGFSKFVIVVPSIAIREGTIKNLEITSEHFATLYGKPEVQTTVWDSRRGASIARQFSTNDSLQILVINIDSFVSDTNVIKQDGDHGIPIEYIRATNPIIIVDEPQKMESEKRKRGIMDLNPLCTLRYSATHQNPYNTLYKLDPVRAYDLGLVKRIEVDSVYADDAYAGAYIRLTAVGRNGKGGATWAKLELDKSDENGLQRLEIKITEGDDLYEKTGREVYNDFVVDFIDDVEGKIYFSNKKEYTLGEDNSLLKDELTKFQIRRTIENHLEKEKQLQHKGIKVLSLFFVERVEDYRTYDEAGEKGLGKVGKWFEEIYEEVRAKPQFREVNNLKVSEVHDGYFAADRNHEWRKSGEISTEKRKEELTYKLILQDKERLLDMNTPLRFIFSHSALGEGWDNPNVFQICTLQQNHSDNDRRQKIGRWLRLPVNQQGERTDDENINILTIIANESYRDFAQGLQSEIEKETGVKFGGRIQQKAHRKQVSLKKEYRLDENFLQIWDRIKYKTRYRVEFSLSNLAKKASEYLQEIVIPHPSLRSEKYTIHVDHELGVYTSYKTGRRQNYEAREIAIVPDVVHRLQVRTQLSKSVIIDILRTSGKLRDLFTNPEKLIDECCNAVKSAKQYLMVDGIRYEKIANEEWEMTRFDNEDLQEYLDNLVQVQNQDKTLYDHILTDSDVEREFAKELETDERIKFYFKLPRWFTIDTPLGKYNPDWAIVFEEDQRIYFVAETKWSRYTRDLRDKEQAKIRCGEFHFATMEDITLEYGHTLDDFVDRITE